MLPTGGAQVDRAFEGLFEQRGFGLGDSRGASRRAVRLAANWTRVQGSLMWALSRSSVGGRVTEVRAMLALGPPWGR